MALTIPVKEMQRNSAREALHYLSPVFTLVLLLLAGSPISQAQKPDPCASERELLADQELQLQDALNALSSQNCKGLLRTVCQASIDAINQQIAGDQKYIKQGCPPGKVLPLAPFDLVWNELDDSGVPLAPVWNWQKTNGGTNPGYKTCLKAPGKFDNSECSTQNPTEDLPTGWNGTWCGDGASTSIDGHVNWLPGTYTGWLAWSDHSSNDDDYNFVLGISAEEAFVASTVLLEFDSDETIDHFATPWWSKFHKAVDNGDVADLILTPQAVVTGLIGLDCEHGCGEEIHPVYSLALEADPNLLNNVWAMFVRNWGDEGYCSSTDHQLPLTAMSIRIPWKLHATAVKILNAPDDSDQLFLTSDHEVVVPEVTTIVGKGIVVRFVLPWSSVHASVNGEIHLQWTFANGTNFTRVEPPARVRAAMSAHREPEGSTEDIQNALFDRLPAARKAAVAAAVASPVKPYSLMPRSATAPRAQGPIVAHPVVVRSAVPPVRSIALPAPAKEQHDQRWKVALCAAYDNNIPGKPDICK
jgi:hypothetical protein